MQGIILPNRKMHTKNQIICIYPSSEYVLCETGHPTGPTLNNQQFDCHQGKNPCESQRNPGIAWTKNIEYRWNVVGKAEKDVQDTQS